MTPVASESRLRNLAWIEGNRRKVEQATNGRVAYVYMPDTAFGGLTNFTRYFYAQVGKEAAIIDERFNGGGALATDIIEVLNRKRMSAVATRDGEDELQPQGAIFGPKVMIINEFAGSGDENLVTAMKTLLGHISRGRTAPIHDHLKGRTSEMEYIPGVVSKKGRELGIPTPGNDAVLEIDRQINTGQIKMDRSNFELLKSKVG